MKTITLRQLCSPCSPDYKHIYRESITINLILAYRFYNLIVHCQMNCDELDRRDSTNRWAHQCFFHGLYGEYCEWTTYTIILHHITLIFFRIFIYQWAINIYIYGKIIPNRSKISWLVHGLIHGQLMTLCHRNTLGDSTWFNGPLAYYNHSGLLLVAYHPNINPY